MREIDNIISQSGINIDNCIYEYFASKGYTKTDTKMFVFGGDVVLKQLPEESQYCFKGELFLTIKKAEYSDNTETKKVNEPILCTAKMSVIKHWEIECEK